MTWWQIIIWLGGMVASFAVGRQYGIAEGVEKAARWAYRYGGIAGTTVERLDADGEWRPI